MRRYLVDIKATVEITADDSDDAIERAGNEAESALSGRFNSVELDAMAARLAAYEGMPSNQFWYEAASLINFADIHHEVPIVVTFKDRPDEWWWTDGRAMVRGDGEIPKDASRVPRQISYDDTVGEGPFVRTEWQTCSDAISKGEDGMRSVENSEIGINKKYVDLVSAWPKAIQWQVSRKNKPAIAVDENGLVVGVVMPVTGAKDWK